MPRNTKPLPDPSTPNAILSADVAHSGIPIPAIVRLRIMSPDEWEEFTLEWTHSLKHKYFSVERCGGSGDMGRDIIGFETDTQTSLWDNYQCKHYDHKLMPSDIWCELGKLCYYSYIGDYTFPRNYYFVSPQGSGNKLSKLLRQPSQLKQQLLDLWDDQCKNAITSTKVIDIDANFRSYIDSLDFSIFRTVSPLTIIEEHRSTPWHVARFGGGLPSRPEVKDPPAELASTENNYIRALLDAYEDRLHCTVPSITSLSEVSLINHLNRSRREFYCAESLREFSKDNVPPGTFDGLVDEVYSGVVDVVESTHSDAYERVLETVKHAKLLSLASNALVSRVTPSDKGGMCHQLSNESKLKWRS